MLLLKPKKMKRKKRLRKKTTQLKKRRATTKKFKGNELFFKFLNWEPFFLYRLLGSPSKTTIMVDYRNRNTEYPSSMDNNYKINNRGQYAKGYYRDLLNMGMNTYNHIQFGRCALQLAPYPIKRQSYDPASKAFQGFDVDSHEAVNAWQLMRQIVLPTRKIRARKWNLLSGRNMQLPTFLLYGKISVGNDHLQQDMCWRRIRRRIRLPKDK